MRIAVIDMGTNTFNMLVAETEDSGSFATVYQHKLGVMLGKEGLGNGEISPKAIQRGMDAVAAHLEATAHLQVDKVKAFATSAIRGAANGKLFAQMLSAKYGIDVEIISGEREAELIYKGVAASFDLGSTPVLIMDIGGGSNEFIIGDSSRIYWKQSFPMGMSRLMERFSPSDPIPGTEIAAVESYLSDGMEQLWCAVERFKPRLLVGSSGSFDTFRDVLYFGADSTSPARTLDAEELRQLHFRLLEATVSQRRAMKGMDELRVEMIVLASILTQVVLRKTGLADVMQSGYALKEGAIVEMITATDLKI